MLRLSNSKQGETEFYSLSLSSALTLDNSADSLHFRVRFSDAAAKQEAMRHDVSIQLVKKLTDGHGIDYSPAAEHIALTTSPVIPGLGPWVPDPTDPLVATKEVLYEGNFFKKADNLRLDVNQKYLDKLISNVDAMLSNGAPFPLQLGHEGDTAGRGKVLGLFKGPRTGKAVQPIGLSTKSRDRATNQFLAIALSSNPTFKASATDLSAMTLDELLQVCGITAPADADDAAKIALLKDWFTKAKAAVAAAPAESGNVEDPAALSQGGTPAPVAQQPSGAIQGPSLADQLNPRKVSMTVALSNNVITATQGAGQAMLDTMVLNKQITPAKAKALADAYNTDGEVRIALSNGATESPLMRALRVECAGMQGTAWQETGKVNVPNQVAKAALSSPGIAGQQRRSVLLELMDDEK